MKKPFSKFVFITFLLCNSVCSFSQKNFKYYLNAGVSQMDSGRHLASIDLLLKAKALKGVDTGYNGYADLYLGSNYEALERMKDCVNSYIEAIKYFEVKNDNYESLAFLYNRLGNIELYFLAQYQKAIAYYWKQMQYDLLGSDSTNLFFCYNNIGVAYQKLQQYDSAFFYFNIILTSNSPKNQSKGKALLSTGDTYSLQKKLDIALRYYDQAIPLLLAADDNIGIFMAHLNKGDCLLQQANYKNSILYLIKAESFISSLIPDREKKILYYNLADVYSHVNDSSTAFRYKMMEGNINDSIITHGNNKSVADAETKYGTRKIFDDYTITQQNLKLAGNKLIISEQNRKINSDRFLGALIGAIVVCIIAFLALRNAALRKKANVKLAAQKAKVEALADKLEEANQTKARLFSVISHDLRSPVSSLYASLKMQELKSGNGKSDDAVSSQIMHLLDTLEDLLTWSKSQMNRFTLQPINLRIRDMYTDLIELHQDAVSSKQITIENKAERQVKIYTDENLLKTIMRNVLANSIHHASNKSTVVVDAVADEGGVVCTISNEATATDAAMLEAKLQTATIGSSKHGLGNVLIKEFTEKLNANFEVAYRDGKVYLQIRVPNMQKASQNAVVTPVLDKVTTTA